MRNRAFALDAARPHHGLCHGRRASVGTRRRARHRAGSTATPPSGCCNGRRAASLIWIGLSTAGLLPSITVLDRGFAAISGSIARAGVACARGETLVPLTAGLAWGLMPCAMVYAALFTAMLTGSGGGGAVTMMAFGIGTLPGPHRRQLRLPPAVDQRHAGGAGRVAAGFAIALFGVATVFLAHPAAALFCLTGTPTGARCAPRQSAGHAGLIAVKPLSPHAP